MKLQIILSFAVLAVVFSNSSFAQLNVNDKLALVGNSITAQKSSGLNFKIRMGMCVAFNKCIPMWESQIKKVAVDQFPTNNGKRVPITPLWSATDIGNFYSAAVSKFSDVTSPKAQIAIMIVLVDSKQKSDSAYIVLPATNVKPAKGQDSLVNSVDIKLLDIDCKLDLAIKR